MAETVNDPITDSPAVSDETWVHPDEDQSIGAVLSRLVNSGKDYAHAELDKQKLRASVVGAGVRDAAIFGIAALILALSAVGALLVGLIITLSPALTPGGATAAVVVVTFVIALVLVMVAKSRITNALKVVKP